MNPHLPLNKQPTQVLVALLRHMYAADKRFAGGAVYKNIIDIIESRHKCLS